MLESAFRPLLLYLLLVGLIQGSQPASAQVSPVQGYRVRIEPAQTLVRVTVQTWPTRTLAAPESFQMVLKQNVDYRGRPNYVLIQDLVIPAGQSKATAELYGKKVSKFQRYFSDVLLIETDRNRKFNPQRDLANSNVTANLGGSNRQIEGERYTIVSSKITGMPFEEWYFPRQGPTASQPTRLVPTYSAKLPLPNIGNLAYYLDDSMTPVSELTVAQPGPLQSLDPLGRIDAFSLNHLPSHWVGLIGIQHLLISLDDLKTLHRQRPQANEALRGWVAMGGRLVVHSCGQQLQRADEVFDVLLPPVDDLSRSATQRHWVGLNEEQLEEDARVVRLPPDWREQPRFVRLQRETERMRKSVSDITLLESEDGLISIVPGKSTISLATTPLGLGQVTIVADDMSGWSPRKWGQLINLHVLTNDSIREGVWTVDEENCYLSQIDIPEVGEPPVRTFQVLISVFVLLVGPVFFVVFRRMEQLHLLLFSVPLVSLIACVGLFGWAIFKDGLGTYGRVHSVTFLDHRNLVGSHHARYSFYAGLQPPGYAHDLDTAVYTCKFGNSPTVERHIDGDLVTLQGGEIRSRTQHQIYLMKPCYAEAPAVLFRDSKGEWAIRNRLEQPIRAALFRRQSIWYFAEEIPANGIVRADTCTRQEAARRLQNLALDRVPLTNQNIEYDWNDFMQAAWAFGGVADRWTAHLRAAQSPVILPDEGYAVVLDHPLIDSDPTHHTDYGSLEFHLVIGNQ